MIAVVDIIGDVVRATSKQVSKQHGFEVFYQYGHIREISQTLQSYSETDRFRSKKYPAVFLLQDFAERMGARYGEAVVRLVLLIVADSSNVYRSSDRYEKVFNPVLYPIYDELMRQIVKDSRINTPYGGPPHEKIDRLFLSNALVDHTTKGEGLMFSDYLDAIEIRGLELNILIDECTNQ
jgi:hypothetical protein